MNPADQRFTERYFKRLAKVEQELQDIKNAQRIGLDNFVYDITEITSGSVYLNSGQDHILSFNFNADDPKFYTSELTMSFFINNNLDDAYHWPDGSALTDASGLRPLEIFPFYDIWNSDETGAGRKRYYVHITNYSAFAKTVHWHVGLVFPKGGVG
jgi:hypothetical protein